MSRRTVRAREPGPLAELQARSAWSALRIYGSNREGMEHGVLPRTSRWTSMAAGTPPSP